LHHEGPDPLLGEINDPFPAFLVVILSDLLHQREQPRDEELLEDVGGSGILAEI
jgi:hypothetical protein